MPWYESSNDDSKKGCFSRCKCIRASYQASMGSLLICLTAFAQKDFLEGFFSVCVCPLDPIAEQNWKLILFAFPSQECLAVAQTRTFKKQFCKLELISHSFQVIPFNLFYWVCFWTWQHFQNRFCTPEKFSLLMIKTGNKLLLVGCCCSGGIKKAMDSSVLCWIDLQWNGSQHKPSSLSDWVGFRCRDMLLSKNKMHKKMLGCC